MNFDFVKDIPALSYLYNYCNNAEKLVAEYPESSLVLSRKIAEAIAGLLYVAAHTAELEHLTFDQILKDRVFRRFVHNRDVVDAFYNIKQHGNKAAHSLDESFTSDEAVNVLEDLHYVTGEAACILYDLDDYPLFDGNIKESAKSDWNEMINVDELVKKMFASYLEEHEKKALIENLEDFDLKTVVEAVAWFREYLYFDNKPRKMSTIRYIQEYLHFLVNKSIERSPDKHPELDDPVILKAEITIDGSITYSNYDIESFLSAVDMLLPVAKNFSVSIDAKGNFIEYFVASDNNGNEYYNMTDSRSLWNGSGMYDKLTSIKRGEDFIYKQIIIHPDKGDVNCYKIERGKEYSTDDLKRSATSEIVISHPEDKWSSWGAGIWLIFDYENNDIEKDIRRRDEIFKMLPEQLKDWFLKQWGDEYIELNYELPACAENLREIEEAVSKCNQIIKTLEQFDEFYTMLSDGNFWTANSDFIFATLDPRDYMVIGMSF